MIVFRTPGEALGWRRTLLAGHPGAGLTRAAASWPNPLYARFRPGLPELADRDLPFTIVGSVDDLLDVLAALSGEFTGHYDTLVVDTVGELEQLVGGAVDKATAIMQALAALPVHVVLLCRLTHKEGRQFPLTCLDGGLLDFVDLALAVDGGHLRVLPDDRLPWVIDRTGRLTHDMPLTFTDEYARLATALGQDLGAVVPVAPQQVVATPAVVPPPPPPPQQAVAPEPAAVEAPQAAPPAPPAPPPAPAPAPATDEAADEDEDDADLPMCESKGRQGNDCLGRVESKYALDLSRIRHRKPMCGPCNEAEFAAMPKKFASPAKAAAPRGPAPDGTPPRPRDEDVAVVPRGEIVGQVPGPSDPDLRAFLNT